MLKPKQISKPFHWRKKVTHTIIVAINLQSRKNSRSKKIPRLKKIIPFPLIVIVGIIASLVKLQVDLPRGIFV